MSPMTMPAAQQSLVERVHTALASDHVPREVAMFGGCAVMVNEKMVVSAGKNGDLLVRVAAEDHEHLLHEPGARQAVMGKDRTMGPGWITVAAESLDTSPALEFWIDMALQYNRVAADEN